MATPVTKKKVTKKKVTKKKATKKKATEKKVTEEYFVTVEEDLLFDQGVLKQRLINSEIANAEKDLQLFVIECNNSIAKKKEKVAALKLTKAQEQSLNAASLNRIRTRLGFEGTFAIEPDTLKVIFPGDEKK